MPVAEDDRAYGGTFTDDFLKRVYIYPPGKVRQGDFRLYFFHRRAIDEIDALKAGLFPHRSLALPPCGGKESIIFLQCRDVADIYAHHGLRHVLDQG